MHSELRNTLPLLSLCKLELQDGTGHKATQRSPRERGAKEEEGKTSVLIALLIAVTKCLTKAT